jgi:FkbM family methyltransferase
LTLDWGPIKGSEMTLTRLKRDLPDLVRIVGETPNRREAVQAGGNLGAFAKYLATEFAAVYTFEPDPHTFPLLVANAPESNIIKIQAALGDARNLVSTEWGVGSKCHEGTVRVEGPGIIPTFRIDDLALRHCDLICLDVEGWEMHAVRGALDTIENCRPVLSVEINKCIERTEFTGDDLRMLISSLGYRMAFKVHADEVYLPL